MRATMPTAVVAVLLLAGCGGAEEEPETTAVEGAPTLTAMVGTEESPDAFEISLLDEDGEPVTELEAGEYNIEVTDPTSIHNFHLDGGDGAVDEKTGVSEKGETTWVVTFEPGDYRYMCDPHPSMRGEFTVT
ncbi:cupredoxin domain-containing protein [Blastococcus sp. PRF04-17]|uniref:cupredoxin domain-containing protein n=1 Tax=Blastococcus sp. PRF04-17 TaxID=2933797 RepID=UPI001FF49EED|nr:plastocyanin/azurin family copper-binding protein [Blastococcus sp. PRF04-17]UOY03375.1 plastocyanin/azurin family copper-binding protein [Blastococcus sp. PRF04-17]